MNHSSANSTILYVEDEENDIFLMRLAVKRAGIIASFTVVTDGREAIDYLSAVGKFADRSTYPFPGLVLLDLNLPGMSGFEVLKWMRATPSTRGVPVVIFTSSGQPSDQARARQLGADDYIIKPIDMVRMAETIRTLEAQWLETEAKFSIPAQ